MSAAREPPGEPMADRGRHTWQTPEMTELFEAISKLESREEAERFCRDLCTLAELEAMAHRWEVARLLELGLPYVEISHRTGASTTTVTRVAHWLRHGEGGYRLALDRLRESAPTT
jgi:TrpR-related protein YerC/YecD